MAKPAVRLCLNAGHCEHNAEGFAADSGARGPAGLWEAHVTTQIVHALLDQLREAGPGVFAYAKRQPGAHTLGRLVEICNASHPDLFVSIHCNGSTNREAQGAQIYYPQWPLSGSARSRRLATMLLSQLPNNATHWSRVVAARFYVLRRVRAQCRVLVETDFITNPRIEILMRTATWPDEIARRLAAGLLAFLATAWRE